MGSPPFRNLTLWWDHPPTLLRTPNVLYLIEAHQVNNIDNNLAENENPKHLPEGMSSPFVAQMI